MFVLIAGSGSSRSISAQYPTTVEFVSKLPDSVTAPSGGLYTKILEYIQQEGRQVDIEEILGELTALKRNAEAITASVAKVRKLFKVGLPSGPSGEYVNALRDLGNRYQIVRAVDGMSDEIRSQMWKHYAKIPDSTRLQATWIPVLSALMDAALSTGSDVELYTLNYDRVLEATTDLLKLPEGYRMENGAQLSSGAYLVDAERWKCTPDDMRRGQRYLLLTKLHGSLNWTRDGDSVVIGNWTQPPRDLSAACLIYPEIGKDASNVAPFSTFYSRLSASLSVAAVIISIGYAHRDPGIESLLDRHKETPLIVINPDAALHKSLRQRKFSGLMSIETSMDGSGSRLAEALRFPRAD